MRSGESNESLPSDRIGDAQDDIGVDEALGIGVNSEAGFGVTSSVGGDAGSDVDPGIGITIGDDVGGAGAGKSGTCALSRNSSADVGPASRDGVRTRRFGEKDDSRDEKGDEEYIELGRRIEMTCSSSDEELSSYCSSATAWWYTRAPKPWTFGQQRLQRSPSHLEQPSAASRSRQRAHRM